MMNYWQRTEGTTHAAVARGLGWVSLAIGLAEIVAPRRLDRLLGTGRGENAGVFRVLGVREIMHAVDLLRHHDPKPGLWARLAGDLLDGALLGYAATRTRRPGGLASAFAMVLPVVLLDVLCAKQLAGADR